MQSRTTELHFPFLYEKSDNEWYMTYREGPHNVPEGDIVKCVQSKDQGQTWIPWEGLTPEPKLRWNRTKLKNGNYISHRFRFRKGGNDYYGYILRSDSKGVDWTKTRSEIYGLTMDTEFVYMSGNIREDINGDLYVMLFGVFEEKFTNCLLRSQNGGDTWNVYSELGLRNSSFTEGAGEGNFLFLNQKSILSVYRTGGPLIYALSEDKGMNWRHFVLDQYGVNPQLLKMKDHIICTYGNHGIKLRYFIEGKFSHPIDIYTGSGSGYSNLQQLSDDRFRVVFDESDFLMSQVNSDYQKLVRVEFQIIR